MHMKRLFFFWALGAQAVLLAGQPIVSESYSYAIEPPANWRAAPDSRPEDMRFVSADGQAGVRLQAEPGQAYSDMLSAFDARAAALRTPERIEREQFLYNGYNACIGFFSFASGGAEYTQDLLWIDAGPTHYWLSSVAPKAQRDLYLPAIFSTFDSLSVGPLSRLSPGPVSQYDQSFAEPDIKTVKIDFNGTSLKIQADFSQNNVAQRTVEREAAVMASHKADAEGYIGWARYYRMIYRDNYSRLESVFKALSPLLPQDKRQAAQMLLSYTQGFSYTRTTETASDLIAPIAAFLENRGDCDSMSLVYIILLNKAGIDALLLLTQQQLHAIAAVDVPVEGSVFLFDQKEYVLAELTAKEPLGTIPAQLEAVADWLPLLFAAPAYK